jgi:predicted metalloprotease
MPGKLHRVLSAFNRHSVWELQRHSSREQANVISVRLELEADCFAGIWANAANGAT